MDIFERFVADNSELLAPFTDASVTAAQAVPEVTLSEIRGSPREAARKLYLSYNTVLRAMLPLPAWGRQAKRRIGENMKPTSRPNGEAASANITKRIQELGDWRGETLAHVRQLIHDADPDIQEEWKWMGTPVWSHDGGVCTGESYKQVVKLTFFRGASIKDPKKLFNSSLEGNTRRAIDLREGEKINEAAFKQLIRAAVAANSAARAQRTAKKK